MTEGNTAKGKTTRRIFRLFLKLLFILPGKEIATKTTLRRMFMLLYRFIPYEIMVNVGVNRMFLRPSASGIERDLFLGRTYEAGVAKLFHQHIKEGMVVLDIGAHIGYYTLIAAGLVGSQGKVFAFEPEPRNFTLLKRNVELNGYGNVILVDKAVSDRAAVEQLYLDSKDSGCHSLSSNERSKGSISISTVSLDEFFAPEETIDFIKIDAEGAEERVLDGMQGILRKGDLKAIILEFNAERLERNGSSPKRLWKKLETYSYEITEIAEKGISRISLNQAPRGQSVSLLCLRE